MPTLDTPNAFRNIFNFMLTISRQIYMRWNLPENVPAVRRSKPHTLSSCNASGGDRDGHYSSRGELTLDCSRPSVSLLGLSTAAQAHLNLASLIAAGLDGGIGFTPTMWVGGQDATECWAISGRLQLSGAYGAVPLHCHVLRRGQNAMCSQVAQWIKVWALKKCTMYIFTPG